MIFTGKALSRNLLKSYKSLLLRKIHINNPYIGYYLPSQNFDSGMHNGYYLPSKRFFSDIAIQNTQSETFTEDTYINPPSRDIYDEPIPPPGNNNDDDPPHKDNKEYPLIEDIDDIDVDDKQLHEDNKNDELMDYEEYMNSIPDSYYLIPNQEYTSFDPGYIKRYENIL